jgi:hypothetical protein
MPLETPSGAGYTVRRWKSQFESSGPPGRHGASRAQATVTGFPMIVRGAGLNRQSWHPSRRRPSHRQAIVINRDLKAGFELPGCVQARVRSLRHPARVTRKHCNTILEITAARRGAAAADSDVHGARPGGRRCDARPYAASPVCRTVTITARKQCLGPGPRPGD